MLVAACWRGGGGGEATEVEEPVRPRERGATCEVVGNNMTLVVGRAENAKLAERARAFGDVIERHCGLDAWSMELRRCLAGAKVLDDTTMCEQLATDEQRQKLGDAIELMIVRDDAP